MFTMTKDGKDESTKETLSKGASHIVGDIKETARHLKGEARDAATAVKEDLEIIARQTGSHVREFVDSAENGIKDAGGKVATKIRDNPIQSSLIALGAGVVLGLIFRR